MGYQKDRERFYLDAGRMGLSEYTAAKLLRYASTLQRLAVAQCNGDYPADNGQRKVIPCDECGSLWAPEVMRKGAKHADPLAVDCPRCTAAPGEACSDLHGRARLPHPGRTHAQICPDCRTVELARKAVDGEAFEIRCEGDPRGYVLRLIPRGTSDEDYQSGRVRPIYVPGRER